LHSLRHQLSQPLLRNAYALTLSTWMSGGLGVVYWAIAARTFDETEVGQNAALISAMQMLSTFGRLDLASAMTRFLPIQRESARRMVIGGYGAATAASLALAIGFVLLAPGIPRFDFISGRAVAIAFCVTVVWWSIFTIQDGVLTGLQRTVVVPIENVAYALAKIVLLVLLVQALPEWGIFVSWSLPVLIAIFAVNTLILGRYLPAHARREPPATRLSRRAFIRYLAYDYLGGLLSTLMMTSLPLIVVATLGAAANARFYIAWTLVVIVQTLALSFGQSLVVEGSYTPDQLQRYGRQVLRRGASVILFVVAVIEIFAPYLLLLFGKRYAAEATGTLRLITLGVIPQAVVFIWSAMARVTGDVGRVLTVVAVSTAAMLAAVVVGAQTWGLPGVAAAYTGVNTFFALLLVAPLSARLARSPLRRHRRRSDGPAAQAAPADGPDRG
jgi:O-antigen/teichoic acid export membrane protein